MTTSSLILNALVCRAIAAVRARSSQNFLRASADTATKPSPPRALAMRTTSEAAFATASSSRRRCRRSAPSSAGRGASPWSRSRPPSRSARRDARGRRADARAPALRPRVEVVLDLDDRRRRSRTWPKNSRHTVRIAGGIRCRMKRALTMMPSQPSFCTPGRPARNLSVTSLPRPALRNCRAGHRRAFRVRVTVVPSAASHVSSNVACARVVDLAEVVVEALDLEPLARRASPSATTRDCRAPCPTAPPSCRRRSSRRCRRCTTRRPTSDRTANTRPLALGGVHHAPRDDAGAAVDRRRPARACPGSAMRSTAGQPLELLGVDHRRARVERNRAAGVAGAAAARNDREPELDAALRRGRAPRPRCPDAARRTDTRRASRSRRSRATRARGRRTRCCPGACSGRARAARACAVAAVSRKPLRRSGRRPRARRRAADATLASRAGIRRRRSSRAGACRSRSAGGAAPRPAACRRRGLSSRSSCRYGLRSTTQMSPSTSNSIRAERPVRRSPRSSSSSAHIGAPSRRMTISRSENDV